jgi:NAD(P)-dependent dehydrogenase (short-subunit alcohol dehydrogenase family)
MIMDGYNRYSGLEGRLAVVTGGSTGIGAAISEGFLRHGCDVAIVDLVEPELPPAAAGGGSVAYHKCDVTDIPALQGCCANIVEVRAPSFLVNNAANDLRHDFEDLTPERFDALLAVNLKHYFFMIQGLAQPMASAGGGSIVNIGSHAAYIGASMMPAYGIAKAGIFGLTRAAARQYGGQNIRVNQVVPGWVMTEKQRRLWWSPEADARRAEAQCISDELQPNDIAEFVLFLCSDGARMCTNQTYFVDGGRN